MIKFVIFVVTVLSISDVIERLLRAVVAKNQRKKIKCL
jgi:hypothetical protein